MFVGHRGGELTQTPSYTCTYTCICMYKLTSALARVMAMRPTDDMLYELFWGRIGAKRGKSNRNALVEPAGGPREGAVG